MFTQLNNEIDILALIFKLLSKTASSLGSELDENFLDECCSLPNQVLISQLDLTFKAIGVASPALFMNTLPLEFLYLEEAKFLKYSIKTHTVDGAVDCNTYRKRDSIRHIILGNSNIDHSNLRSCTRCSVVSLIQPFFKSPSTRAWDQRWCSHCICGGHWRLSNL